MLKVVINTGATLLVSLALVSCASISVEPGTERATQKMPEIIYVADFSTVRGDFEVDRKGAELAEFEKNLQLMLKTAIAADLTDKLVPAAAVERKSRRASEIRGSCAASSSRCSRGAGYCAVRWDSVRGRPSWKRG